MLRQQRISTNEQQNNTNVERKTSNVFNKLRNKGKPINLLLYQVNTTLQAKTKLYKEWLWFKEQGWRLTQ
jgi:hypothetical protein